MSRITFLMTVHDGEQFVRSSIESVLKQSEKDLTLFSRNNGSHDRSLDIIKEYAKKDSRIRWTENRENNVTDDGVHFYERGWWPEFHSDYVSVLDHDDILHEDFAKIMCNAADNFQADLVISGCTFFEDGTNRILSSRIPPAVNVDNMRDIDEIFPQLYGSLRTLWGKIYKTAFFDKYYTSVRKTPDDLKISRDTYWVLGYLEKCNRFVSINQALYFYRRRSGSGFHSTVIQRFRVKIGDILFDRALECLKVLTIDTHKNVSFLYCVHWGHMTDLMELLSESQSMSLEDKLEIVQEILSNSYLKSYLESSFNIIWNDVMDSMSRFMPDFDEIPVRLFDYYIVRLYSIHKGKCIGPSPFLVIFSSVRNIENRNCFGIHLLSQLQGKPSLIEKQFRQLPLEKQKLLLKMHPNYSDILPMNFKQEVEILEERLSEAAGAENYSVVEDIINEINLLNPLSEYSIYYQLYLATLSGADMLALKQSYQAVDICPGGQEIKELCQYVQSIPVTPIEPHMEYRFEPNVFNLNPEKFKCFSCFIDTVKNLSFPSLLTLSYVFNLRMKKNFANGKMQIDSKETMKFVSRTLIQEGIKGNGEFISVLQAIRELKNNVDFYNKLYCMLKDILSQNALHNILLYRFTGEREYLKGCMTVKCTDQIIERCSLSAKLESLRIIPNEIQKNNKNIVMSLSCSFTGRQLEEIFLEYE